MKTQQQTTPPQQAPALVARLLGNLSAVILLSVILAWCGSAQAGQEGIGGKRSLDAMTVNLYFGGGVERILEVDPNNLPELVAAVTGVYYEIVASEPALRMQGVADRIAARLPDVVAVNEASLIRVQSPGDLIVGGTTPATTVVFDYLQLLIDALEAKGAHYAVVSSVDDLDIELPMQNLQTGSIEDARLTDRDAILVRTDLPPGQLRAAAPLHGNFATYLGPDFGVPLPILRGWCSIELFVRGENFRFICSHLEEETAPPIQFAQAQELLAGPANVQTPVIIAGDLNADPLKRNGTYTYPALIAAGFVDPWPAVHPADAAGGLTWGHDEFLADPTLAFVWRLDLVLVRGSKFVPAQADVLDLSLGRTQPPLWSSDHAAVAVKFMIK